MGSGHILPYILLLVLIRIHSCSALFSSRFQYFIWTVWLPRCTVCSVVFSFFPSHFVRCYLHITPSCELISTGDLPQIYLDASAPTSPAPAGGVWPTVSMSGSQQGAATSSATCCCSFPSLCSAALVVPVQCCPQPWSARCYLGIC